MRPASAHLHRGATLVDISALHRRILLGIHAALAVRGCRIASCRHAILGLALPAGLHSADIQGVGARRRALRCCRLAILRCLAAGGRGRAGPAACPAGIRRLGCLLGGGAARLALRLLPLRLQ